MSYLRRFVLLMSFLMRKVDRKEVVHYLGLVIGICSLLIDLYILFTNSYN